MSISAYRKTIQATERPRDMERRILSEINAALLVHQEHYDSAETRAERTAILAGSLRPALAKNLKLWAALRMDLLSPGNELPAEMRANLISLSLFVERQVTAVMGGRGSVKALTDVNARIIAGLSGHASEAA